MSAVVYGIGYARISGSKEQRDSALSIPAQERHYRAAMERENVIHLEDESDILQGTRSDRPGYQRLLAMVRRLRSEGQQVAVFIFRLDRFGRDVEERSRAWKELAKLGVRLYAVQNGGWITERFLYDLDAALAQREVTLIGQRITSVNDFVRSNGFPKIGRPAWGYALRPSTPEERSAGAPKTMLVPHPDERAALQHAWKLRAEGGSLGDVHRWVMSLPDRERGKRRLARATFARLFNAAVYVGRLEYPKGHPLAAVPVLDRPHARWEPLIDDETFRRVARLPAEHSRRPKQATGRFLLTGVLRCYRCGARMTGRHIRSSDRERGQQYTCIGAHTGANATTEQRACSTIILAATIDAYVLQQAAKALVVFDDPDARADVARLWDELRSGDRSGGDDVAGRLARAEQRRTRWVSARAEAFADYASGDISKAERDEVRARAAGEIEDAEREITSARRALAGGGDDVATTVLPPLATILARRDTWGSALAAGDTAAQRELLSDLIETVTPVLVRRGVYRARIEWTSRGHAIRRVAAAWARAASTSVTGRVEARTLAGSMLIRWPGQRYQLLPNISPTLALLSFLSQPA